MIFKDLSCSCALGELSLSIGRVKSGQAEVWELLFWTGVFEILAKTLYV